LNFTIIPQILIKSPAGGLPQNRQHHPDLNWGKWNVYLDFTSSDDRETLKDLLLEADVVVSGYRPGYQPVSDACVGISHGFGKAMGLEGGEPVTALFPTSDYSTGLAGVAAVLSALIQRADNGGSYSIDLALNYYNSWLAQSCGEYLDEVCSTWLFPLSDAPYYPLGAKFDISMSCIAQGLVVCQLLWLRRLNRIKEERPASLLKGLEHLGEDEQFRILGDHHPRYKYIY